ncbi:hypothetical protein KIF59_01530 [Enterobacter cloacae subsp. cloacae]|nr:hypothetical protein [Enterobacter cloacae subsp. cloacae]
MLQLWGETRMTVFMAVTHDFRRLQPRHPGCWCLTKVRLDPQAPNAYGARITYDIPP